MAENDAQARAAAINRAMQMVRNDDDKGEGIDKVLRVLDSIGSSITKLSKAHAAMAERLDALEASAAKDDGGDDPAARGDPGSPKPPVADDARADAAGQRVLADQEKARAWTRIEELHSNWGVAKAAPPAMPGEQPLAYRKRLLQPWLKFSTQFRDVDLDRIDAATLPGIETSVINDALAASLQPSAVPEGQLRAIYKTDASGRRIVEWLGEPRVWMREFAGTPRRVVSFRTQSNS